jgi:SNF family Na+-dependent transporter
MEVQMMRNKLFNALGVVVAVVSLVAIVYFATSLLDVVALRATVTALVFALPISTVAAWWFGSTEARGRLAGIDQAVDKVMSAATRTADTARAIKSNQAVVNYTLPPIMERQDANARVIEL